MPLWHMLRLLLRLCLLRLPPLQLHQRMCFPTTIPPGSLEYTLCGWCGCTLDYRHEHDHGHALSGWLTLSLERY